MRILTERMNVAIVQIASRPQTGFVPGCFIAENIMLLKLIQAYVEDGDAEALFLFLDMEKAFDRCSWDYLHKALECLGFNESFRDFVGLAYSADHPPTRQLHVNGYLGPSFPILSGVAQGCPASPLLFIAITEAFTRMIMHGATERGRRWKIRGVKMGVESHKISQFADDSTLILTPGDAPSAEKIIDIWCRASAMRENATKREGMLLGALRRNSDHAPQNLLPLDKDGNTTFGVERAPPQYAVTDTVQ